MGKKMIWAIAAAIMMAAALPVYAETVTTNEGVVSLEIPNTSEWKKVPDAMTWTNYSNGYNTVAMLHYVTGEKIPGILESDEFCKWTYQRTLSNDEETFVFIGISDSEKHFREVRKIVDSIKVQKYYSKNIEKPFLERKKFSISDDNKTVYVTSQKANIRSGNTKNIILGSLIRGDSVQVVGSVMYDENDTGWYKIKYDDQDGYIYSGFTSEIRPSQTDMDKNVSKTNEEYTLYDMDGASFKIYKYSDEHWYDDEGEAYEPFGKDGNKWKRQSNGGVFTTYPIDKIN